MTQDSMPFFGFVAPANDNADGPRVHRETTYRVVVEDEHTGQEYRGWRGLSRDSTERIAALINSVGAHAETLGALPKAPRGRTHAEVRARENALEAFALEATRAHDAKARGGR